MDKSAIKNCRIIPRPGKTFWTMNIEIKQGKIKVQGYKVIAFLLGTNDVDGVVSCKFGVVGHKRKYRNPIMPRRFTDMNSIINDFHSLMNTVKARNPQATIVICGSIPRLGDWAWSKPFSLELNDYLQQWCCAQVEDGNKAIFAPTHAFFQKSGLPLPDLYRWDGVHLSDAGLQRIRQCLQQALSDSNLDRGGAWKRRPVGRPGPCFRSRKVRGNLIVF